MAHWKKYMDKELLGAWDLEGRDVTVTIESVSGGEVTGQGNKKNKKPIATLRGTTKKLALNATNCKTIEQLAGSPNVDDWRGLRVTLFPTTTTFGGQTVDCIRIRPYPPRERQQGPGAGNGRHQQRGRTPDRDAPPANDVPPADDPPPPSNDSSAGTVVPRNTEDDDIPDVEADHG